MHPALQLTQQYQVNTTGHTAAVARCDRALLPTDDLPWVPDYVGNMGA